MGDVRYGRLYRYPFPPHIDSPSRARIRCSCEHGESPGAMARTSTIELAWRAVVFAVAVTMQSTCSVFNARRGAAAPRALLLASLSLQGYLIFCEGDSLRAGRIDLLIGVWQSREVSLKC
jgi:hypothetical protein